MRRRPLRPAGALAVFGLSLALSLLPAAADYIPGKGSWDRYHFSLDETVIRISLVNDVLGKADFPDLLVPRAYVLFVSGAPPSTAGPLPPLLMSDHIKLLFVDGTGEPWSVAVTELAKRERIAPSEAAKRIRSKEIILTIYSSKSPRASEEFRRSQERMLDRSSEVFEALPAYRKRDGTQLYYYLGEHGDEFLVARCHGPGSPPATHSTFHCSYSMDITDGVVAEAQFADFRAHGGRQFANRRLRFAREAACRFLTRC